MKYYRFFIKTPTDQILDFWTTGKTEYEAHKELVETMISRDVYGLCEGIEIRDYNTLDLIA